MCILSYKYNKNAPVISFKNSCMIKEFFKIKMNNCILIVFLAVSTLTFNISAKDFGGQRVVCYFTNWSQYRAQARYTPENIDPSLCTHINYAFALLDENSFQITVSDDNDYSLYPRTIALKQRNPNLKILLALGGWTDSRGDKYSVLVSDSQKRKNFNKHAVSFLKQYGFDGLDLDWEYPDGTDDKNNFSAWIKELRELFDQQNPPLLLSAAVVAYADTADNAYNIPDLGLYLDHINIMSYDLHGTYDGKTGHHAQMYSRSDDSNIKANVEFSINYWAEKGIPKEKMVIGVPFYGRSFTLADPSQNGLNAPITDDGNPGTITREKGVLLYVDICNRIKQNGWTKIRDERAGPYAFQHDQWVGYDDPESLFQKARYSKTNGYGGIMIWEISMDDFTGSCCSVNNPLLKAIRYGLTGRGTPSNKLGCE